MRGAMPLSPIGHPPAGFILPSHFLALALCAHCLRLAGTILGLYGTFLVTKCPNLAFSHAFHAFGHVFHALSVARLAFLDEFYAR